jgi:hypothetical protein
VKRNSITAICISLVIVLVLVVVLNSIYPLSLTSLHDLRSNPNRYAQQLVRTRGILSEVLLGDLRVLRLQDGEWEILVQWGHQSSEEAEVLGKWVEVIGIFVPPYTIKASQLRAI